MKISINFDDELLTRLDNYAKSYKMNRASVIRSFCVKSLNEEELINSVKNVSKSIRKIADTNKLDEESRKVLEEFDSAVSQLMYR